MINFFIYFVICLILCYVLFLGVTAVKRGIDAKNEKKKKARRLKKKVIFTAYLC